MADANTLIWLIDGGDSAAAEQRRLLEQSGQLEVRRVPLRATVEEYADLAANVETGAVLVSQALERRSKGAYSSTAVADYLRTLRFELPIFILSPAGAAEEIPAADGLIVVEELQRRPEVYVGRILRAAGRYAEALSARQQRLQTLLDRQFEGSLTADEAHELAELRAEVERPTEVRLAKQAELQDVDRAEKRHLVEQLETLAEKLRSRKKP